MQNDQVTPSWNLDVFLWKPFLFTTAYSLTHVPSACIYVHPSSLSTLLVVFRIPSSLGCKVHPHYLRLSCASPDPRVGPLEEDWTPAREGTFMYVGHFHIWCSMWGRALGHTPLFFSFSLNHWGATCILLSDPFQIKSPWVNVHWTNEWNQDSSSFFLPKILPPKNRKR